MITDVLARGLGGRTDLALNGAAAVVGGATAVAVSFAALAKVWSKPWLDPNRGEGCPPSSPHRWIPESCAGRPGSWRC